MFTVPKKIGRDIFYVIRVDVQVKAKFKRNVYYVKD